VYRQFEDVEAFHEEIKRLRGARAPAPAHARGARAGARRRAAGADAKRDQLPLLPPEPAADDGEPGAGGQK
jgi:hypothetical protein